MSERPVTRPSWADAFERAGPKPEAPVVTSTGRARGSCKAIDEATGRQCRLPAHDDGPHRSERGVFTRTLQPGHVPTLHQRLDELATRHGVPELLETRGAAAEQRASRERLKAGVRRRSTSRTRKSAHAGDDTSTGLASIDKGAA